MMRTPNKINLPLGFRKTPIDSMGGIALLEALVAILILSLGILGLIGLQGRALAYTDESGYRGTAVQLAGGYAAELWAVGATGVDSSFSDEGSGALYERFQDKVSLALPRTEEAADKLKVKNPTVIVNKLDEGGTSVIIRIYWMMPGDQGKDDVHHYDQETILGFNGA